MPSRVVDILVPAESAVLKLHRTNEGRCVITWPSDKQRPKFDRLTKPEQSRLMALLTKLVTPR